MTTAARTAIASALLSGSLVAFAPSGSALSCVALDFQPEGQPVIFSGVPHEARGNHVRFEVDRVWKGPDLAPHVWVTDAEDRDDGLLAQLVGPRDDLTPEYEMGTAYVVGASEEFVANGCTVAEMKQIAAARIDVPADARLPVPNGETGADAPLPGSVRWALVASPFLALVGGVVVWRRTRRARIHDHPDQPGEA